VAWWVPQLRFLIELKDSNNVDYVNLTRAGGSDCVGKGIYDCTGTNGCVANAACAPVWPSAYVDRDQWEQHQLLNTGPNYPSVNTFPTCNWTTNPGGAAGAGTNPPSSFPKCGFTEAAGGTWARRRRGRQAPDRHLYAKFALVATRYLSLGSAYTGGFELTIVKKKTGATLNGAVDLNVVLVARATSMRPDREGAAEPGHPLWQSGRVLQPGGHGYQVRKVNAIEWRANPEATLTRTSRPRA